MWTCVHRDGGRDFDWGAAGDADCAAGGTSSVSAWDCRDFSDDTEFGAVRIFNSDSVYRRNWKADGDCGVDALCVAADSAEYVCWVDGDRSRGSGIGRGDGDDAVADTVSRAISDRKSTRLNSSHQIISYAVFCLKKKNKRTL